MDPTSQDPLAFLASLGWVDITAAVVLVVFLVLGIFKGLLWQLSRIVTLLLAFGIAGLLGERLASATAHWFSPDVAPGLPRYVAFLLIFVLVLIVVSILAFFLHRLVHSEELSAGNRVGGAVLGLLTGALIVLALLTAANMLFLGTGAAEPVARAASHSYSQRLGKELLRTTGDVLPASWRDTTEDWAELFTRSEDRTR